MQRLQDIRPKDVAKYTLLPGVIPRINEFIESGFGWLAFIMAVVYNSVRLLPNGHEYLNPQNIGKFGVRHVIAEAANRIILKKENIDQIVIFFALLIAFVLLFFQCFALALGLIIKPAAAVTWGSIFVTVNPANDIAYMLMDKVFAVPGMFQSQFDPGVIGMTTFQAALQQLFQFYSFAILVVAVFIFLYYVIVVVGETANTGTPFGRRFNHIYAPLRLVFAIGILVPISYGYNAGQFMALYAAKIGSSMATNGWITFNANIAAGTANKPTGLPYQHLLARPNLPDITNLVHFMTVVKTCVAAYDDVQSTTAGFAAPWIEPYVMAPNGPNPPNLLTAVNYQTAVWDFENKDVIIRFGHRWPAGSLEENYLHDVDDACGEIVVPTQVGLTGAAPPAANDPRIGAFRVSETYYNAIVALWNDATITALGEKIWDCSAQDQQGCTNTTVPAPCNGGQADQLPPAACKSTLAANHQTTVNAGIIAAHTAASAAGGAAYDITPAMLDRGWGGAAIWYNRIAEFNGLFFTTVINVPNPSRMPYVMTEVDKQRRAHNETTEMNDRYVCSTEGGEPIQLNNPPQAITVCRALNEAHQYWMSDGRGVATETQTTGNVFFDLLNSVFGIGGLFTMRNNDDVHPLAQLSALGKSIIESSIRNLLGALVFSVGGGAGEIMGLHLGAAMNAISNIFIGFTSVGLSVGFILYYVLPFLPFMYFFFAIGGWIKTIFEAMVGIPLWALAHLRLDGNGFPGDSASNGYFLIFEIFVRPILTVFGLIASMGIFTAMARTLNGVFDLVVENLTGFDCNGCTAGPTVVGIEFKRNAVDEFFFTIIYTILVYMLATSSFKMIDQVPNSILRWMGAGVQSFSDQRGDPAGNLVQYAAFGGSQISGQVSQALNTGAKTIGQGVGLVARTAMGGGKDTTVGGAPRGADPPAVKTD